MSFLLDLTGSLPSNRVINDSIAVSPATLSARPIIYPGNGLFFEEGLTVTYMSKFGRMEVLEKDIDFKLYFQFDGIGPSDTNKVYAGLKLKSSRYDGHIVLVYQALGGNIRLVYPAMDDVYSSTSINENNSYLAVSPYANDNLEIETPSSLASFLASGETLYLTAELRELPEGEKAGSSTGGTQGTSTTVVEVSGNLPNLLTKATETNQAIKSLAAAQGQAGEDLTPPNGAIGVIGWLYGIYKTLTSTLTVSVSNMSLPTGAAREDGNLATIANKVSSTLKVSADALPLPTGSAKEDGGHLEALANAQGTDADGVGVPIGGSGIRGWLSGIYGKLSGVLKTEVTTLPSLPAGSNTIGKVTAIQSGAWNMVAWGQAHDTPPEYASGANMPLVLNTSGQLTVDASAKPLTIGQSALPSGAATETTLATVPTAIHAGFKTLTYWTALNSDGKTRSAFIRQETKDASGVSTFSWFDNTGTETTAPASPRLLAQEEVGTKILERVKVSKTDTSYGFEGWFTVGDVLLHLLSVTSDLSMNTDGTYFDADMPGIQFDLWVNENRGRIVPYPQVKQYSEYTELAIKKVTPSDIDLPSMSTNFMPVMGVPQRSYNASASEVLSSAGSSFSIIAAGSGMAVTQSAGFLNVTTGTTASATTFMVLNEETGFYTKKFKTPMVTKATINSISQRIANQNFSIEIMDEVCLNATVRYTSTTTATIVMPDPNHIYGSQDVGKKLQLLMDTGSQVAPYQTVTITAASSVYDSVKDITFVTLTVSGVNFPASSAALNCYIYGENRVAIVWTGTTATNAYAYIRKDGWDKVSASPITTLTSASECMYYLNQSLEEFSISDILPTSTAYPTRRFVNRYSPREGLGTGYIVAVVIYNAATAPASTTTFKLDEIEVNNYVGLPVQLANVSAQSGANALLAQMDTNSTLSTIATVTSVTQLNGKAILLNASMGYSTAYSLASNLVGAVPLTEYSAQALAASVGTLATSAPTTGGGAYTSYAISLTAWTAGSSTGLCVVLQWSPDNGTNWYDLWHVEPMTAIGVAYIPPLMIPGRRRFRWANRTGAATTATVTITANELSGYYPPVRQYFDFTATVLSGTLSAATAGYDVIGCKVINAFITIGAATTAGTYQLQISNNNGTSWVNVGTETQAVADSTIMLSITNVVARLARVICTSAATGQTGTRVDITGCN